MKNTSFSLRSLALLGFFLLAPAPIAHAGESLGLPPPVAAPLAPPHPATTDDASQEDDESVATPAGKKMQRPQDFPLVDSGIIKAVPKSDLIVLDNNRRYRLDNIRIPVEYDHDAIEQIRQNLLNKRVNIYTYHRGAENYDRYGLFLAHAVEEDGTWVQADMVAKGLAWAFCTDTSRKLVEPLKQLEEKARDAQVGFWQYPAYVIKAPTDLKGFTNSFQIIEGEITSVSAKKENTFFYFSKSAPSAFVLKIPIASWPLIATTFSNVGNDPETWKGHTLRFRGWVEDRKNGAAMELTTPEQIDFIR